MNSIVSCLLSFFLVFLFIQKEHHVLCSKTCWTGRPLKVALLGDSLMRHLFDYLDFTGQMLVELNKLNSSISYDLIYNSTAADSNMIQDIRDNQLFPAINWQPDATFIYWDTDVSDISEWGMSTQDAENLRNTFRSNVDYVVISLLNYTNTKLALTGPGILGEDRVVKQDKYVIDCLKSLIFILNLLYCLFIFQFLA